MKLRKKGWDFLERGGCSGDRKFSIKAERKHIVCEKRKSE